MVQVSSFVSLFFLSFFQYGLLQSYDIDLAEPIISPECELEGICDSVENYPTNIVQGLIERLQSQNTVFNYDQAPLPTINMRFNVFYEEPLSLCETRPRYVPPKAAKDRTGSWQYIINDSQAPVQVFKTEICRKSWGRCSKNVTFTPGYDGKCIQKKELREMFYLNETKGIGVSFFEVPTCCSCSLFRKDDDK